jgi:hypothetical protein
MAQPTQQTLLREVIDIPTTITEPFGQLVREHVRVEGLAQFDIAAERLRELQDEALVR